MSGANQFPLIVIPSLHTSTQHPESPLLNAFAILPGLYSSIQNHCTAVIDISQYRITKLLVTVICIKKGCTVQRLRKEMRRWHWVFRKIAIAAKSRKTKPVGSSRKAWTEPDLPQS